MGKYNKKTAVVAAMVSLAVIITPVLTIVNAQEVNGKTVEIKNNIGEQTLMSKKGLTEKEANDTDVLNTQTITTALTDPISQTAPIPYTNANSGDLPVNETTFPDPAFRSWLEWQGYASDGVIAANVVPTIKKINMEGVRTDVTDLTGIEYFTGLKELNCRGNKLTKLDVSKNIALEKLYLYENQLTELDISKNTALTDLDLGGNLLKNLDVSQNHALQLLNCAGNQLTSLDISQNKDLVGLHCGFNQLTELDVSNNTALQILYFFNNKITNLDLSQNKNLEKLIGQYNQLETLDVSNNTALKTIQCQLNRITALDVSNNTALTSLFINDNQLTSLDLSKNTALTTLDAKNNKLISVSLPSATTKIDLSNQKANIISPRGIDLTTLAPTIDVSKISALSGATLTGTSLTGLQPSTEVTFTYKVTDAVSLPVVLNVKMDNNWTTPLSIENWRYGEDAKNPIAEAEHGKPTFVYSNAGDGTFTDSVPSTIGTWYVKAIVEETKEYAGLESDPIAFEINKVLAPAITEPTGLTATVGDTLAMVSLPNGWNWADDTVKVTEGNNTYTARFTVDDENYDYTNVAGYNAEEHYVERAIAIEGIQNTTGGSVEQNGPNDNNPNNTNQLDESNNVQTGDNTAAIAGGMSIAAVLSACTAWFVTRKKKRN